MELAAKLDDYGKPAWIVVMILGFILFWPLGLAILAYLIWSGRMGCEKHGGPGRWWNMEKRRPRRKHDYQSSGNTAFDEYRATGFQLWMTLYLAEQAKQLLHLGRRR